MARGARADLQGTVKMLSGEDGGLDHDGRGRGGRGAWVGEYIVITWPIGHVQHRLDMGRKKGA